MLEYNTEQRHGPRVVKMKEFWLTSWCLRDHTRHRNNTNTYVFGNLSYLNLSGREWSAKEQCEDFR
jgi:hypothetical protein